jgi:hypothetical protein
MYSYDHSDDRLSIAQMNSALHQAHLELLSAHCATHQLSRPAPASRRVLFQPCASL